jgi:hypothetical protein
MIRTTLLRYVTAIGVAGEVEAVARALQEGEQRRMRLVRDLAALDQTGPLSTGEANRIERELRARMRNWRQLLGRHTTLSRQIVMRLVHGRIGWTPRRDEGVYAFAGAATFGQLLSGVVATQGMVAVRGFDDILRRDYRVILPAA